MTTEVFADLDTLSAEDVVVRNLARTIRDGPGMHLDAAVAEMSEFVEPARVEAAAARIRVLNGQIQSAQIPRAVVAGNIESWYAGPRAEDRNWSALYEILVDDGWRADALKDLDDSSTKVVANLPNPHGGDGYQCRGLVLGYVQSGKTTNFTAVIAKAADAGYRFFIVLSGVHNALRQQTQDRLNGQLWDRNPGLWNRLTDEDDFRPTDNVDALLANQNQRVLAIVKKNGPRLRALKRWLFRARPELLAACPVLIVDDEADQATVNTSKPDRKPSRISGLIRDIVNELPKSAYVGYTATPFANVLMDPGDYEDLYPRDFIVDLPRPAVYIGPEAIFGREPLEFDAEGWGDDDGYDFVRTVPEEEIDDLRPKGSKSRHEFDAEVTPSLERALTYFLMSTAARRVRGKGNRHATALVHTSQHVDVHERMAEAIDAHLRSVVARLGRSDASLLAVLRDHWEEEVRAVPAPDLDEEEVGWDEVAEVLPQVAEAAVVITDNSRSLERLHFDPANPRVIIAVGGNTLSRGLTLEGLSVSFFVRTASAYDTLLQMGRWFGYRSGYADLTRIWMTDEMRAWFHHLATVEEEIRYDIARYEAHVSPEELGVRVRTHPKLAITAAAKMQHAKRAEASYSGRRIQTILFNHRDAGWLEANLSAARWLVEAAGSSGSSSPRPGITILGPVPSGVVIDFLTRYKFHENSRDLDGQLISRYIEGRLGQDELSHFRVAVMARGGGSEYLGELDLGVGQPVGCINRARLRAVGGATYADIKTLMSRSDRVVDLGITPGELKDISVGALAKLRNPPEDQGRGDGSGLVLLYPVSKDSVPVRGSVATREPLEAVRHVVGAGLVFPESRFTTAKVDYVTAGVDSMRVQVETPDEDDVPDDEPEAIA